MASQQRCSFLQKHENSHLVKKKLLCLSHSLTVSRPDVSATCVEVNLSNPDRKVYGVVRFFGQLEVGPKKKPMMMAGVELVGDIKILFPSCFWTFFIIQEEDLPLEWGLPTDGCFGNMKYFDCAPRRGIFVPACQLRPDHRFHASTAIRSCHGRLSQ